MAIDSKRRGQRKAKQSKSAIIRGYLVCFAGLQSKRRGEDDIRSRLAMNRSVGYVLKRRRNANVRPSKVI